MGKGPKVGDRALLQQVWGRRREKQTDWRRGKVQVTQGQVGAR